MFEFLTLTDENDAIGILKKDHDKVKGLFDDFEKAENLRQKKKIAAQAIMELKVHASIEEEIFYPAVRRAVGGKIMNEADEEHHVAKLLIAELERMNGSEEHYQAKFKVLSESVRHHIKEEEGKMLPEARELDIDFSVLGRQMLARKRELMKKGVATFAEEKLIGSTRRLADSPARAAKTHRAKTKPKKAKAPTKVSAKVSKSPLLKRNVAAHNSKTRHKQASRARHA